jgi:hypothetical protein
MDGNGSANGGCSQQHNARYLTATSSAASRLPPPPAQLPPASWTSTTSADNGGWARVLYDTRVGLEKLTIIRRIPPLPAPNTTTPPAKRKPGHQASDRRRARDRRRREAWAKRRRHSSQSRLHTPSKAEAISATAEPFTAEPFTAEPATAEPATPSTAEYPQLAPQLAENPQPTEDLQPALPPLLLCQSPKPAHTSADPEQVLCKECQHNHHHIRYYHCSQYHIFPISLYPRFKDPNRIYDD